jgi:hypothetical protein
MRLPFNLSDNKSEEDSRVKFTFTSPDLHQNIEISLDGDDISVEILLDAFHRFLSALGICTPDNVVLGFIDVSNEDQDDDGEDLSK